uniref:Uncharacterized protein n=1 Tax=Octopus bimaculoides TaxID=37653 RepID=A0A0L8HI30_OCTBM
MEVEKHSYWCVFWYLSTSVGWETKFYAAVFKLNAEDMHINTRNGRLADVIGSRISDRIR